MSSSIRKIEEEFSNANELRIHSKIGIETIEIKNDIHESIRSIVMPSVASKIQEDVRTSGEAGKAVFSNKFEQYRETRAFKDVFEELEAFIESELKHALEMNRRTLKLFAKALEKSKNRLEEEAEHYYLDYTFKKYATELVVAELVGTNIDPGVAREAANLIVYESGYSDSKGVEENVLPKKFLITFYHIGFSVVALLVTTAFWAFRH